MNILLALMAGIVIGVFFSAGLRLTVRQLLTTRRPVLLTVASFWGRTFVALAAFLWVMNGRWENALAALAGFALGRVAAAQLPPKGGPPRCT